MTTSKAIAVGHVRGKTSGNLISLLIIAGTVGCMWQARIDVTGEVVQTGNRPGDAGERDSSTDSVVLNELLASNRSSRRDHLGKNSDWIELYNPGTRTHGLLGYCLTDDLQVPDKWRFPNVGLPAGGYQVVWMSGRNPAEQAAAVRQASVATVPFQDTLIAAGSQWKYLAADGGKQPARQNTPRGWAAVDFDASAFSVGAAGFGYGDQDDATELASGTTSVLLRHEFTLVERLVSGSLILQVDYDDGFAAYLNGTRVAAANCPRGEPGLTSVATANHEAGIAERFDLSAHVGLLRRGKNVLAIIGLNNGSGSSDMSLNAALGTLAPVCDASFSLKRKGGSLYLIAPDGTIADEVHYPAQQPDQTLGRIDSKQTRWGYFLAPTPGSKNVGPAQPRPVKSRISFFPAPGPYPAGAKVQVKQASSVAVDIRFTEDGSEPNSSSPLYGQPVRVDKTSTLRAACFVGSQRASPILSATYLVDYVPSLPVISVSMKPADFLDVHLKSDATGHESERPAFLEMFAAGGERVVATGFGLRLHGGAGRRGDLRTKKSYRTYFRKSYGMGRVDYPIIPTAAVTDYDKLVLRANSNDRAPYGSNIRDQVIRDVHSDMGALAAGGSWYVLLINALSRGIYNVTERMDEEFLTSHLGPGPYDVIKTGETTLSGSKEGWNDLRRFVRTTDFSSDTNFEELARRVDVEDFTSYIIVNLCLQNFDWPHNNWYAARRVPDGKWIFLCWDSEWGLGYRHPGLDGAPYGPEVDPYAYMDSGGAGGNGLIRLIFLAMLDNPGYRDYYQQEVRRHLRKALAPENITRHIHRHRDAIATDMKQECEFREDRLRRWYQQLEEVERFAATCPKLFQTYTDAYFSSSAAPGSSVRGNDDRVALTEDRHGGRQVIYRTAKGQLRALVSSPDASTWTDTIIPLPVAASPAGAPHVYSLKRGKQHLLYRDADGHLHDLTMPPPDAKQDAWQHRDLTSLLKQPAARCDPSVTVVDGVPHIVYVDESFRAHEIWFAGQWRQQPLPFAPRPASEVVISSTPGAIHVNYRTIFGVPCEQTRSREAAAKGLRTWSHRIFHRLPAAGQPIGFNAAGNRRIIYQVADKWPVREPFVFRWHARRQPGYREYNGGRNRLVQAWNNGKRYHELQTIGPLLPAVVGTPRLLHDTRKNQHYLAYRNEQGQIQEAFFQGDAWKVMSPTDQAEAPPASGDPAGLVSVASGTRYYVYRGRDGHLHELGFTGSWSHRDLTRLAQPSGN